MNVVIEDSKTVAGIVDEMMIFMDLLPSEVNNLSRCHISTG